MSRRYKKSRFKPKRGIRTFRDLYVYERSSKTAVGVRKFIDKVKERVEKVEEEEEKGAGGDDSKERAMSGVGQTAGKILKNLEETVSKIPLLLARAHSRRFSNEGMEILDDVMELCNRAVVFLEQTGQTYEFVEEAVVEEYIARYEMIRRKIFNLYKAWKRSMNRDKKGKGRTKSKKG